MILFGGNKYICKGEFTKMEIIVLRKHRLVSTLKSSHLKKRRKQKSLLARTKIEIRILHFIFCYLLGYILFNLKIEFGFFFILMQGIPPFLTVHILQIHLSCTHHTHKTTFSVDNLNATVILTVPNIVPIRLCLMYYNYLLRIYIP